MNLTFQRATESQQAEIYELAGVNREEALDTFKQMDHTDVRLNVYAHNQTAMHLYEQLGFSDVSKFMKIDI